MSNDKNTPPLKSLNRRRYRLHVHVKELTNMNARKREVYVTDRLLSIATPKQRKAIDELRDRFGYNIQFIID